MVRSGQALQLGGERRAGERAAGEDGEGVGVGLVELGDLFAVDGDAGFGGDAGRDALRELDAIDGEGVAGGDGGGVGVGEQEASGAAHLLLEQPGGGVFTLGLEGVGADELGEVGGLVGLSGAVRAHLVEVYGAASGGGLERGLGAGEAAADYFNLLHVFQSTGFWADFTAAAGLGRERLRACRHGQDLLDGVGAGVGRRSLSSRLDPPRAGAR